MYQKNDVVFYRRSGVCTVTEIEQKKFYGKTAEYYVLCPLGDEISTFFIPTGREDTMLRPILTKEEAGEVLDALPGQDCPWIASDTLRREKYKGIISGGNPGELAQVVRSVCTRQMEQKACGKKLHASDEALLEHAQKLLCGELSYVLNISSEEVLPLILKNIGPETGRENV